MNSGRSEASPKATWGRPWVCPGRRSTRSRKADTYRHCRWPLRWPGSSTRASRRSSMSTHDSRPTRSAMPAARWAIPVVALAAGVGYLIAGLVGDNVGFGIFGLVLMVVFGAAFVLLRRSSETVAGLMDRTDERINSLDRDATMFAGSMVLVAAIVMFMVEIA